MKVKICGMTQFDQFVQLNDLGACFAGIIFYEKSPRYVKKFNLDPIDLKRENWQLKKVGVFVNETLDTILKTVEEWGLDFVQLHGDEPPKFCEQVRTYVKTIKAFRLDRVADIEWKVYPYIDFIDLLLFDSGGNGSYGGTGQKFNWNVLEQNSIGKPFLLSGGIGPDDITQVKSFASFQQDMIAVDVNSKFETSPGIKDMEKVRLFLNGLND